MTTTIEGRLVFPDRIDYGQLVLSGADIVDIIDSRSRFVTPDMIIEGDKYISPGFVDLQINGAFGKEFKTDEDALHVVSNNIYKFGTTSFCPTITTSELTRYSTHARKLVANNTYNGQAKFIGFHFEGPLLNPTKAGAQNASLLKAPKEIDLDSYLNEYTKIITLAPEIEGSAEFIAELKRRNIMVGIGHSSLSYEALMDIYDESCMMIVHLFNAMDPLTSRNPGIVGAALSNDNCIASIIVDGIHLHPATCNIVWRSKQVKEHIICITDGSAVTGLGEGTYNIGDRVITRLSDRAILPNGTLVGSVLTLNIAARNLQRFTRCSMVEAINTVSLNPARFLGIEDEIGQLKIGNKADLVIVTADFEVEKTFINGVLKYECDN